MLKSSPQFQFTITLIITIIIFATAFIGQCSEIKKANSSNQIGSGEAFAIGESVCVDGWPGKVLKKKQDNYLVLTLGDSEFFWYAVDELKRPPCEKFLKATFEF